MLDLLFRLSQLTLPVATIICTACMVISNHSGEAFFLFWGGFIFTFLLRLMEQQMFEYNSRNGYYD
jgi:hypothetical protein